jgi:hypothetical protein
LVFFLWTKVGCAERDLRRAGAHLRHAGDLIYRAADRRSGELRYRLFLTELSPAWLKRPLGIAIELLAAIPSIVYGMWGLFIFAPLFATYFQEPVGNVLSTIPFVGAVCRPGIWYRYSGGGRDSGHHDHSVHRRGYARCLRTNPVMMKESAYGIGCTTWKLSGASFCRSPKMG